MSDDRAKWLAGLKVGDEVMVPVKSWYRNGPREYIAKVEAASKAYLTVDGRKFHRTDGKETGLRRGGSLRHIRRITFDDRDGKRRKDAIANLRSFTTGFGDRRLESVPTERIEQAVALLTSGEPSRDL